MQKLVGVSGRGLRWLPVHSRRRYCRVVLHGGGMYRKQSFGLNSRRLLGNLQCRDTANISAYTVTPTNSCSPHRSLRMQQLVGMEQCYLRWLPVHTRRRCERVVLHGGGMYRKLSFGLDSRRLLGILRHPDRSSHRRTRDVFARSRTSFHGGLSIMLPRRVLL